MQIRTRNSFGTCYFCYFPLAVPVKITEFICYLPLISRFCNSPRENLNKWHAKGFKGMGSAEIPSSVPCNHCTAVWYCADRTWANHDSYNV